MARNGLFGLIGKLAVAVGLATVVSNLEKKAKEEGRDITDVAADKVTTLVDSVKSGELQKDVLDKADRFINGAKETIDNTVESVKSGEIREKATELVDNLRDGVADFLDGKGTNSEEDEPAEEDDSPEDAE